MSRLRVAPIVEGHGEVQSIRILLERVWRELLGGDYIEVLAPIRLQRSQLVQEDGSALGRAVDLALLKLKHAQPAADEPSLVLLLLDADEDPACILAPRLLAAAFREHAGVNLACVLANTEYETWFVAAAESLSDHLDVTPEGVPSSPEELRLGKGWISRHFKGARYSETVDQPRMTARMDLGQCRARSPSFDKLCRELEKQQQPD